MIRTISLLAVICAVCFSFKCAPNIPIYQENSNSEVEVTVQYFSATQGESSNVGNVDFKVQFAQNIAALLQKKGVNAIAAPRNNKVNSKYIITGNISKIDPGIWSLRFWIGFGAGSAKFDASASLINTIKGVAVSEYQNERISTSYLGNETILQRVCLEVAEDIIEQFDSQIRPQIQ